MKTQNSQHAQKIRFLNLAVHCLHSLHHLHADAESSGNPRHTHKSLLRYCFLFLLIIFGFHPARARADLISTCGNTSVVEGTFGVVNCLVVNLGDDPVLIDGVFAFSYSIGGDPSDKIISLEVIGPDPPCDDSGCPSYGIFQVLFQTSPAHDDPHPDVGLNDVSLILYAEDAITGDFVSGFYSSAAVGVFDVGLTPVDPVDVLPVIPIFSPEDYYNTVNEASSRGYVTNIPEPAPLLLLSTGIATLVRRLHRSVG